MGRGDGGVGPLGTPGLWGVMEEGVGHGVQGQQPAAECYNVTMQRTGKCPLQSPMGPAPLGTPNPPETPEVAPTGATHRPASPCGKPEGLALGKAPCRRHPDTSSSGHGSR